MSLQNLDKEKLNLILKTSEGFPAQLASSQADVFNGKLRSSTFGHALTQHLRGVAPTVKKTKFCSLHDMATALDLVLKTPEGISALQKLPSSKRETVKAQIAQIFDIEAELATNPPQKAKFTRADLAKAGIFRIGCRAILEYRTRGLEPHLHVQSFFPELGSLEITRILAAQSRP
jgi:hypothetical protein